MTNENQNIHIPEKTTRVFELIFKKNNICVDITGWTIFFTAKVNLSDTDEHAVISKTITTHEDALNGKTLISLTDTDTTLTPKSYYYDIKYKDAESPENIGILFSGRLTIERAVTLRKE